MNLVKFATWAEVLAHAAERKPLYYQAPLDVRPTQLLARPDGVRAAPYTYEPRARTVRIFPPGCVGRGRYRTSDPFTANAAHLERFSREAWT